MKKKYIAHANMPPRFPFYLAAVGWLLLDRLGAPGWARQGGRMACYGP